MNEKESYLHLYTIALKTLSLSLLDVFCSKIATVNPRRSRTHLSGHTGNLNKNEYQLQALMIRNENNNNTQL